MIYLESCLFFSIKREIKRYKNAPIGTVFTQDGAKINPRASMHQALLVQEWMEQNPNTTFNKQIWESLHILFKYAPHAIAITGEGIELQDHQGNRIRKIPQTL